MFVKTLLAAAAIAAAAMPAPAQTPPLVRVPLVFQCLDEKCVVVAVPTPVMQALDQVNRDLSAEIARLNGQLIEAGKKCAKVTPERKT